MSIIHEILSGIGVFWDAEKTKINANFDALNADKAETSSVPTNTSDLTNDSDFVADAGYVATDNNFTDAKITEITANTAKRSYPSADETRLATTSGANTGDQDLSAYATTIDVDADLATKVDKDGAKVLTDVNFNSADKVAVDTISDKQDKQTGYGLTQNNYSNEDLSKVVNVPLDTNGSLDDKADLIGDLVPLIQLPDSVKFGAISQFDVLGDFPNPGDIVVLYLARDTNLLYRWTGTAYAVVGSVTDIAGMPEIGEALADDDLLILNDTSAGEDRSSLTSRMWTYIEAKIAALTDISGWASVLDEDTMVSDDATKVPTQQSVKAYVDASGGSWDGDITDIDIVGGTAIGDIVDDDLIIVGDTSDTGIVKKSTASLIWQYIGTKFDSGANGLVLNNVELKNYSETKNTLTISTATMDLDLATGNAFEILLGVNVTTVNITNPASVDERGSFTLIVEQNAPGATTITWPAAIKWPGGTAPTLSTGNNEIDMLIFSTIDAGTTWYGRLEGANFS